jgi:hypothetical protein
VFPDINLHKIVPTYQVSNYSLFNAGEYCGENPIFGVPARRVQGGVVQFDCG